RQIFWAIEFLADYGPIPGKFQRWQWPVAGVEVLRAHLVLSQAVANTTEQRKLVGAAGQLRQMLAELHARHVGRNCGEFTAVFRRRVRLWVKTVQMARPACKIDEDCSSGRGVFDFASV